MDSIFFFESTTMRNEETTTDVNKLDMKISKLTFLLRHI